MEHPMYPESSADIARKRHELAPAPLEAFQNFSRAVFAEGALPSVTKQLIAVAVAHTTQCPYCIRGHTKAALKAGATEQQIMEAIWVAAEMRAGGAYAHSALAIDTMQHAHGARRCAGRRLPAPRHHKLYFELCHRGASRLQGTRET